MTALRDSDERLKWTLWGIDKWRNTRGVSRVVVCDGSCFDLAAAIGDIAASDSRTAVEVHSFRNDRERVQKQGKGFGEGEIIRHALRASTTLAAAPAFAKCTGKLWVNNFDRCLAGFNGAASFDYLGILRPRVIDTRFYIVSKTFYLEQLEALHEQVNDEAGTYLEHLFSKVLLARRTATFAMAPPPRIEGMSGSTGTTYAMHGRLKDAVRRIRSAVVTGLP